MYSYPFIRHLHYPHAKLVGRAARSHTGIAIESRKCTVAEVLGQKIQKLNQKKKVMKGLEICLAICIYIVYTHSFEYTRSTFFFGPQGGVIDIMSCNKAKVRMVTFAFGESCNPIVKW